MPIKIVFLDMATMGDDIDQTPLKKRGDFVTYPYSSKHEIPERIRDAHVVMVNKLYIGKDEIDSAENLKLICVSATGINNIDTDYARMKGIPVMNVVNYSTESVAQITFGSLLALVNNTIYFDKAVKDGSYSKNLHFTDTGRFFHEICGMNYGIIGMGNIGKRVAEIASGFGCNVFYYPTSGVAHCNDYPALELDHLLKSCDIISIHAPLNERTANLINSEKLKLMKSTAIIINLGRGAIVNEQDLADAVDKGVIGGAAIDVYSKEPIPEDHPYLRMKNRERMVLTPHIGWASKIGRASCRERV